jgi:hypothetical protein
MSEILHRSEAGFRVCRLVKFSVVILYSKFLFDLQHNRRLPIGGCVSVVVLSAESEVQYVACGCCILFG